MFILNKNYLILSQVFFIILSLSNCSNNSKTIILNEPSDTKIFNKGQSFLQDND